MNLVYLTQLTRCACLSKNYLFSTQLSAHNLRRITSKIARNSRFSTHCVRGLESTNHFKGSTWWKRLIDLWTRSGHIFSKRGIQFAGLFMIYPASKSFLFQTANCEKFKLSHKSRVSPIQQQLIRKREPRFSWYLFGELIQPDFLLLVLATVCAFCVAIVNIKIPIALGELINSISDIIKDNNSKISIFDQLYEPCMKLVWKYSVQSLLTFVYITALSSFGERLATRMRIKLFQSLMEQDVSFFDARKTGEIISRLTTDIQDFKSSFKQVISQGLRSVTQIIGCGFTLYTLSPKLTYLMILILPGVIMVGTGLGHLLRRLSRMSQEQIALAMSVADEAIGNIRTVRVFAMEPKEIGWYSSEVKEAQKLSELLGAGIGFFQGLSNFAINGIILVVLYAGAVLIDKGEMKPGDLMSYLVATQTVQKSLASVSVLFGQLVRGMTAGTRVFEYMELRPSMQLAGGKKLPMSNVKGNIVFKDVKFTYPTRPDHLVIDSLNLEISAGKMIAFCGSSGSGKSTIAALIERLYDVDSGRIEIDGMDVREMDPSWLRGELIGYINQEPTLFATSVMENIRYGCPNAKDHEVYEAAKRANADGFIRGFPQGYDTIVGERGATVSGGQKQRIAIARALLKNPRILILDEATSALDAESERMVQDAIDELVKGRTVIVIAHRLSTIQNADVIAAVSHGKIIEVGTHQQLIQKNGLYAELIRRQTSDI